MVRFNLPISDAAASEILAVPGVNSVAEGLHEGQRAVVVGINSPSVANDPRIPPEVEGLPVVTEVEGRAGPADARPPLLDEDGPPGQLPQPVSATSILRHRPIPPGVSIGHKDISAGTSSFLAMDGSRLVQLSNSHVLARNGKAAIGDSILQPGAADGGRPEDEVGGLAGFVELGPTDNLVDLAWYDPEVEISPDIAGSPGAPRAEPRDPELGDQVTWIGRTSGVSTATVDRANAAVKLGPSGRVFTNQFRINRPLLPGDSGSPVILETASGAAPAGLGFAATEAAGYCNYITNVEAESGLTVILPTPEGGDTDAPARAGIPGAAWMVVAGAGLAVISHKAGERD